MRGLLLHPNGLFLCEKTGAVIAPSPLPRVEYNCESYVHCRMLLSTAFWLLLTPFRSLVVLMICSQ